MNIMDHFLIKRLEKNGVYSASKDSFIIGNSESRMVLKMPKQIMNIKIKEWNDEGIMKKNKGTLLITGKWEEIMGIRLNRK
jgi:hypothetical protein